jgi:hypothetical protein
MRQESEGRFLKSLSGSNKPVENTPGVVERPVAVCSCGIHWPHGAVIAQESLRFPNKKQQIGRKSKQCINRTASRAFRFKSGLAEFAIAGSRSFSGPG